MSKNKHEERSLERATLFVIAGLLLLALVVNFGLALKLGIGKPMVSDARYFLEAAQSLATGEGYRVQATFWPGEPSMRRFPGWPFVVSLALRVTPGVSPDAVMRCVALCVNAAAAMAIAWLTWLLFGGCLNHGSGEGREEPRIHTNRHESETGTSGNGCVNGGATLRSESRRRVPSSINATDGLNESEIDSSKTDIPITNNDSQVTPLFGLQSPVSSLQFVARSRLSVVGRLPEIAAAIAGLAYVFYPAALFNAYTGLSEPLFVLVVALGVIAILKGIAARSEGSGSVDCRLSVVYGLLGSFLLGCATLIRGNFLLWLPFVGGLAAATWVWARVRSSEFRVQRLQSTVSSLPSSDFGSPSSAVAVGRRSSVVGRLLSALACIILFLLPASLWTARNHKVCGHFPVLSTLGGQVLYGGNNEVVANDLQRWGYWVFPDQIPDETPMAELAKTMSEYEVDQYNKDKGKQYLCEHWFAMPRLLLGKMIRAYIPMPWRPNWGSYAVAGYRWMLIVGVVIGLVAAWRRTPGAYRLILSAMVLTNVATVLVFYGSTRFAFSLEPFLLPFFGVGVVRVLVGWSQRGVESTP